MIINRTLIGAVEAATFDDTINPSDLSGLVDWWNMPLRVERGPVRGRTQLASRIPSPRSDPALRLEKVFNSTLEMRRTTIPSSPAGRYTI